MSNLSFDYLPVCAHPGWNPDRLDTSRRILKRGPVQAPGPWKLDTSREDFRYSFEQQSPCGVVSRLGLEPRNLAVPDFKSVLQFAVRGFTKTQLYKSVRCVYQFRQRLIFRTLKSFADLRHTLYNLHLYSINEETRSEHWVATPILPAPDLDAP